MSDRRLVKLAKRYPHVSRMTLYRWRQRPDFPKAIFIYGTDYHYEDELEAFEESNRRPSRRAEREAAAEGESESAAA